MTCKVILVGRVGKKEFKKTKNGIPMCSLSIQVSKKFLDAKSQPVMIKNWHIVYFFNKLSEIAERFSQVGDIVYVEGELNNRDMEFNGISRKVSVISGEKIEVISTGNIPMNKDVDTGIPTHEEPF